MERRKKEYLTFLLGESAHGTATLTGEMRGKA